MEDSFTPLTYVKRAALTTAALIMIFGSTACATKKYVRRTVSAVQARVSTAETNIADHASAISALENAVSQADEKATEAARTANEAGESANRANENANKANAAAGLANDTALRARARADETYNRLENIDNYQLVRTETILFVVGKHELTRLGKQILDAAAANIRGVGNYELEVEGFTDTTGSKEMNLELSRRRAEAVVRYLTTTHGIPLRKIHVIGEGEETASAAAMHSRAGRKQARRVELKVYALDLTGSNTQRAAIAQ